MLIHLLLGDRRQAIRLIRQRHLHMRSLVMLVKVAANAVSQRVSSWAACR
jgi:hypothetical protein